MLKNFTTKKELDEKFPKMGIRNIKKNYENVRNEFETGDLIFFSGNHWLSSLIRFRSKAAWSHVGIVIRVNEIQRIFLAESIIEVGVRLIPLSFVVKNYDGYNKPYNGRVGWARYADLTKEQALKITEFCTDNLSKQYDRNEYWRVLWRTVFGREKIFHDQKYSCAEYVYEAFKTAGIYLKYERGDFISAGGIWENKAIEMKGMII